MLSASYRLSPFFDLAVPQPAHLLARRQQIVQRAFRLDPAILQHDDVIGPAQRGAAMRGDEEGERRSANDE